MAALRQFSNSFLSCVCLALLIVYIPQSSFSQGQQNADEKDDSATKNKQEESEGKEASPEGDEAENKAEKEKEVINIFDKSNSSEKSTKQKSSGDISIEQMDDPNPALNETGTISQREERRMKTEKLRSKLRNKPVVVYGVTTCNVCDQAERWLKQQNVSYEYHDVDENKEAAKKLTAIYEAQGWRTNKMETPTIQVGTNVMRGWSPEKFKALAEK